MWLWLILTVLFVGGVYGANHFLKPSRVTHTGATFAQKHMLIVVILAVIIPIAAGVILANTTFSQRSVVKKAKQPSVTNTLLTAPITHVDIPEPVLKMVISDGSRTLDIATLNLCKSDEVTVIENQLTLCKSADSSQVKAWLQDAQRQEREHLKKYIAHQREQHKPSVISPRKIITPMLQGFGWFAPTPMKDVVGKKTVQEKKPFKDRHAEVFFFLALVAGVMSKYFWDFYEERRGGKESNFEPHVIVMSFIISALIYYSIQQGLEKEAGKLTTRGMLFAFNNGFMWQTILKSTRLSNGAPAVKADEQPSQ